MKKIMIAGGCLLVAGLSMAQQEGKVSYERVTQVQIRLNFGGDGGEVPENMLPKTRKDNFELLYANNQSLWKQAEERPEDESMGGDGMQFRVMVQGSNDVLFSNLEAKTRVERREMFDRTFIIDDSLRPMKWKMTTETKSILGHNCMKAVTTQQSKRTQMNMNNGKLERKEVEDTSVIIAWFATDIPVSAGPAEYQGQLPGLILEMDIANGRQVYRATEISPKVDIAAIKPPTGKKRYTPQEFRKEREKMMDEMQKNGMGAPGRSVRFN